MDSVAPRKVGVGFKAEEEQFSGASPSVLLLKGASSVWEVPLAWGSSIQIPV